MNRLLLWGGVATLAGVALALATRKQPVPTVELYHGEPEGLPVEDVGLPCLPGHRYCPACRVTTVVGAPCWVCGAR